MSSKKIYAIGDTANGVETNAVLVKADSYIQALELVVENANSYCRLVEDGDYENYDEDIIEI